MRAVWIDSQRRRVSEVNVSGLKEMQERVGGLITVAGDFDNNDSLFVDDEGLLKDPKDFFFMKSFLHPLAGNGLIVGFEPETGETVDAKISAEAVRKSVIFMDRAGVALWVAVSRNRN